MELLIAAAISSLVVSGLLFLVVELLRIDNREIALEEVQRDTQRALNYIADDLSEAVYVYKNPATVTNLATGVGAALPSGGTPILAFWKVNPITTDLPPDCSNTRFPLEAKRNECNALMIRRGSYDLVVYSQINGPAGSWKGKTRISRYMLQQYSNPKTLTKNPGYANPSSAGSSFNNWKTAPDETVTGSSQVLVDYVAGLGTSSNSINCGDWIPHDAASYVSSQPTAKADTSFFACIRDANDTDEGARFNQDVYLFLKGDASGRSSSLSPASEASRSPTLQTQVLVRGIINKSPTD